MSASAPETGGQHDTALVGGDGARARHVAIIMDGNGRWAKKRHLPRAFGHKKGVEALRSVVRGASDLGIECLTLYAFSSENWRRPEEEIGDLMGLMRTFIRSDLDEMVANNVQLRIIGDFRRFPKDVVAMVDDALARTSANTGPVVCVALNYGAQDELVRATQALARDAAQGKIDPDSIDNAAIEARLDTADLPPLDLLIRTSGEIRLSNFLLWQAAYAELYFTETLWPDFNIDALSEAVEAFAARERRFGGR